MTMTERELEKEKEWSAKIYFNEEISSKFCLCVVLVLFLDLLSEDERGGKDFDFALPKGSSSSSSSSIIYIIQNV